MPGLLDIVGYGNGAPFMAQSAGFDQPEGPQIDEAASADAARQAAAGRMQRASRSSAMPFGPFPGMLSPDIGSFGSIPGPMTAGGAPPTPPPAVVPPAQQAPPLPPPTPVAASSPIAPAGSDALPPNSMPTSAMPPQPAPMPLPPQPAPAGGPGPIPQTSLVGRIGDFLSRNSNTLMGLGAGLAGAPSLGTGISRGLQGAQAGQQADIGQHGLNQTVDALIKKGVPRGEAEAIANNPAYARIRLPEIYAQPELKMTTGIYGEQTPGVWDPTTGTYSPAKQSSIPYGATGTHNGRPAIYRGGQWWYTDK